MKINNNDENEIEILVEASIYYKLFILLNFILSVALLLTIHITKIYQIPLVTYFVCIVCVSFYPYLEEIIANKKENLIKINEYSIISYLFKKSKEKEYCLSDSVDNKLKNSKLLCMPFEKKEKEEILNLLVNFIK